MVPSRLPFVTINLALSREYKRTEGSVGGRENILNYLLFQFIPRPDLCHGLDWRLIESADTANQDPISTLASPLTPDGNLMTTNKCLLDHSVSITSGGSGRRSFGLLPHSHRKTIQASKKIGHILFMNTFIHVGSHACHFHFSSNALRSFNWKTLIQQVISLNDWLFSCGVTIICL